MRSFFTVWFGQLVSMMGTFMTQFALIVWAYNLTGNATTTALMGFFSFGAMALVSPLAGVWVDRHNRKHILMIADAFAGFATIILLLLYWSDSLNIWHIYAAQIVDGIATAFFYPAYTAATSLMVPKSQFGRVNGLRSLARYSAEIGAPMLAGVLLVVIDIHGVMLIDVLTFAFGISTIALVKIPEPTADLHITKEEERFWHQLKFGFRYIFERQGLMGLMLIGAGINFFAALTYFAILPPLILARTGGDEVSLAMVQASIGIGGVVGGLLMSIWGGPKKHIHGALGAASISFLIGDLTMGIGRGVEMWVFSGFIGAVFIPFISGGNLAIWQIKVPPQVQGRVFAVQGALRNATTPLGFLLGGVLADHLFEPAMVTGRPLAEALGWLVGTGPGAGMGVMFLLTAVGGCLISAWGYAVPSIRNVEAELPDFDVHLSDNPVIEIVPVGIGTD